MTELIQGRSKTEKRQKSKTPIFGKPVREIAPARDGWAYQTLQGGRLIKMNGMLNPESDNDVPLEIPVPTGLVVRSRVDNGGEIIKGDSPLNDTLWRYVGSVKTPDERIKGGYIGWKRDKKGQFTIPIMHPDHKPEPELTFGLDKI